MKGSGSPRRSGHQPLQEKDAASRPEQVTTAQAAEGGEAIPSDEEMASLLGAELGWGGGG